MIAFLPLVASADEPAAEEAAAPPPKPATPKYKGPFDAPVRKSTRDDVSPIAIPKQGQGIPGDDRPPAKLDVSGWSGSTARSAVVGPNGGEGLSTYGFYDGGQNKPKAEYSAYKKFAFGYEEKGNAKSK
jgi:hypothetical protein